MRGRRSSTTTPAPWMTAASPQAAASVTTLMKSVVTSGTADGVGFSPSLDAAVKTGTAQTGNPEGKHGRLDDRLRTCERSKIAVAVVVPLQAFSGTGAGVAGSDHEGDAETGCSTARGKLTKMPIRK